MVFAAALALTLAGCSPAKKSQPVSADASVAEPGATSYLFAGERIARDVHWTREGDVVAVSAQALWRLPGGVLARGATLVDTQLPEAHGIGRKRNVVSVFDPSTDRWVVGGEGFISVRDPKTLAEIRRIDVGGVAEQIVLAKNANVALVYSCPDYCNVTRVQLDTGAQAILGRITADAPLVIAPDGSRAAFSRDGKLMVFTGDAFEPSFTASPFLTSTDVGAVFTDRGDFLYGAGKEVGRWDPTTGKSAQHVVERGDDENLHFASDPALGRVIATHRFDGPITVYDGAAPRVIPVPGRGCGSARPTLEDPNQFECPHFGTRIDAAGAQVIKPTGVTLRFTESHVLRARGTLCEVASRSTGAIVGTGGPELCLATFSPDGLRIAWVDGTGAVTVRALTDLRPVEITPRGDLQPRVAAGVVTAHFHHSVVLFGPRGFQRHLLADAYRSRQLTPEGVFWNDDGRIVGMDHTGTVRLHALELGWNDSGGGAHTLYASGTSVVSAPYGEPDRKVASCRFDAECTELEISPAVAVAGYEAPWIVTSTTTEPDAPNQVVYYLRHDQGREIPRRIIVGRDCSPPLLLEHGDKLACPGGDQVVTFDTKTGQPLGDGLPLDLDRSPMPRDTIPELALRHRPPKREDAQVLGHGEASFWLRTAHWLGEGVHLEERALPVSAGDAGAAAGPALRAVAVVTDSFGVVWNADGAVRMAGDVAAAERLLACRRGSELLPWSACRTAALVSAP